MFVVVGVVDVLWIDVVSVAVVGFGRGNFNHMQVAVLVVVDVVGIDVVLVIVVGFGSGSFN